MLDSWQRIVFKRLSRRKRRSFSLRMAPMIDIIFLLLIFFLVAAKWRPEEHFLPFQLPTAQASEQVIGMAEPLIIQIFAADTGCQIQIETDYTVQIENEKIDIGLLTLMEKLKACLIAQKRFAGDPVEIVCQGEVKWDYLAKIYNLFVGAGLTDITFQMTE